MSSIRWVMQKTLFKIAKMDCPSEEQMIRMALAPNTQIHSLAFDIANRQMTVIHEGDAAVILQQLQPLNFDSSIIGSELTQVTDAANSKTSNDHQQSKLLWQVLAINLLFFIIESVSGWLSGSMGLVADSLDMLADSFVYGLALFAVGHSLQTKQLTAKVAGVLQLLLAVAGLMEVVRRFLGAETIPNFAMMIGISILALLGNALCLYLLQKSRSKDVHMQASMIFTSNDVIVNLGVILTGVLTWFTQSRYPDLLIGLLVFALVASGAVKILRLSNN